MNSTDYLLIPSENMSSSSPPPKTSHLTSVPTEILLRIISHLPFTTSFLALVQTSHGLRRFFKQHARQICNTHILSWYSVEAEILESVLKDGWFVPTHSCIAKQERLLLKEKWKDCASCSRSASSDGKDNDSTSVILSPFDENGEVSDKLPPVQQRSPCLEQHEKELCLALSTPGPQYLRFLEEYSFEILVRYQVEVDKIAKKGKPVFKAWSSSQSTLAENNNDDTEDDGKGGAIMFMNSALIRRSKIRKVTSPDFEWKVGTYAVRRFILKLDAFRKDLDEPLEPDTPRTNGSPNCDAEVEAREKIAIAGIWEKIQNALKIKKRKKRKLGFREIEDEKSGGGAAQERSEARGDGVRKGRGDARMWGLLWYYGISGVANCPDEEEGRLGWVEAREREKEKEQKTQKCVEGGIGTGRGRAMTRMHSCRVVMQKVRSVCRKLRVFGCAKRSFDKLE